MNEVALVVPLGYPALRGVETLPVGSAKVPHLPYLPRVIRARDAAAAKAALWEASSQIERFVGLLHGHGYESMARTAASALSACRTPAGDSVGDDCGPANAGAERLNSAQRSLLEWVYAATFKTAGHTTMEFVPWAAAAEQGDALRPRLVRTPASRTYVAVPPAVLARIVTANAAIYELAVGSINAAHAVLGRDVGSEAVVERALAHAADRQPLYFDRPTDAKSVLKIDYKVGDDGRLIMVDLNAGTIGAWFDDVLLDELGTEVAVSWARLAPRQAEAAFAAYVAARGSWPLAVAVTVLDGRMFDQWYADDLAGLIGQLREHAAENGHPVPEVPVITMAALKEYAESCDDTLLGSEVLNDVGWTRPDLIVAYSWGTTHAEREVYGRLHDAGIVTVDQGHHSFLAAKEFAVDRLLRDVMPDGLTFPPTVTLGSVEELLATGDVCAPIWAVAERAGWDAVAVKTQKVRRPGGRGDLPSAMIYPVTPVGREVAGRLGRLLTQVKASGGGRLLVTASRVELGGGLATDGVSRRDVELRTYAYPILP
ncbi:MAG: hypothetical protein V2J16_01800 [Thermoleophilia bacterium]|jgi:hypothetical protein|nr:hypothetical protein [Thermoleophilia bacterium]